MIYSRNSSNFVCVGALVTGWGFNQMGGKGWGGKRSASVKLGALLTCPLAIWLLFILGTWQRMLTKMFFANSGNSDVHFPHFNQQLMQISIIFIFLKKSWQLNSFENTLSQGDIGPQLMPLK